MTATRFRIKRQMPSAIARATVVLPVPPLKLMAAMTDFGNSILDIVSIPVLAPSQRAAPTRWRTHEALACTRHLRWQEREGRAGRTNHRPMHGQHGATHETDGSALFRFPLRQPPDAKS